MQLTPDAEIDELLGSLLDRMRQILDRRLVGLYLYGSLVTGDFDRHSSDIDLLAVTSSDLDEQEFDRLDQLHRDFIAEHQEWDDRIEIAYLSVAALKTPSSVRTSKDRIKREFQLKVEPFY